MKASLVITVDTEPDNQWKMPAPGGPPRDLTFANTRGLGRLIDFLRAMGAPATWLICYSVARDAESARVLRGAAAGGDEIGGHLHAWETPPFTSADPRAHAYIYEYDAGIRLEKLRSITAALEDTFGTRPVSYRAGRWGIDALEYEHLAGAGYSIDTSVVPGHDFRSSVGLARGGPDFRRHLSGALLQPYRVGPIWEAPVSTTTVGAIGGGSVAAALARSLAYRREIVRRAAGKFLAAADLCRLVWVRPLVHPRQDLIRAALALLRRGASVINVMFHSSETLAGTSPRTRSEEDVARFYGDMEAIVGALLGTGCVTPLTLRDAVAAATASRET